MDLTQIVDLSLLVILEPDTYVAIQVPAVLQGSSSSECRCLSGMHHLWHVQVVSSGEYAWQGYWGHLSVVDMPGEIKVTQCKEEKKMTFRYMKMWINDKPFNVSENDPIDHYPAIVYFIPDNRKSHDK